MQIRGTVHNGIANGFFWFNRAGDWNNAKPWDSSHVMSLPDYLKTNGIDLNFSTSITGVLVQFINHEVNIRPTVNRNFSKGEWVAGNFSFQLA